MNARLEAAELFDELLGGHVSAAAPETPFDSALLATEQSVGTLQQVLSHQVVLTTPLNLVPVLRGEKQKIFLFEATLSQRLECLIKVKGNDLAPCDEIRIV